MRAENLQHILRAACDICGETDFVIVGSQAILGSYPHVTDAVLTRSIEADLYPRAAPHKSDLLNAIGELSLFHETHGYYADGVDETTATLPRGWNERLVELSGHNAITARGVQARGWCLEPHDLLIAKLCAGRDKDIQYCGAAVKLRLVNEQTLLERLRTTRISRRKRLMIAMQIADMFGSL